MKDLTRQQNDEKEQTSIINGPRMRVLRSLEKENVQTNLI